MQDNDFRRKASHIPIAREGIPYIGAAAFITLILAVLGLPFLTFVALVLSLLVLHFFRDPGRLVSADDSAVLAAADGKIIEITKVEEPRFTHKKCWKISTFMSVFNVHVNRAPVSGELRRRLYEKGKFRVASSRDGDRENERCWLWVRTDTGHDVVFTQVAGLVARRIVCWPKPGARLQQGERFGIIRFGSRSDVYVSEDCEVAVRLGEHVSAGESVLCRFK